MKIHEKLPSRLELILSFVNKLLEKLKPLLLEKDVFNIKLSLEEALVNAVKHGNKLRADLFVEVIAEAEDGVLRIKVKDQGEGFDFNNLPNPTQNDNLQKTSGRGIFLIRNLMDKVEFFDCGKGVEMIKFLRRGGKA